MRALDPAGRRASQPANQPANRPAGPWFALYTVYTRARAARSFGRFAAARFRAELLRVFSARTFRWRPSQPPSSVRASFSHRVIAAVRIISAHSSEMSYARYPRCRLVAVLYLIAFVLQVSYLYRPAQCSSLIKYLSTEYNLSQVSLSPTHLPTQYFPYTHYSVYTRCSYYSTPGFIVDTMASGAYLETVHGAGRHNFTYT